MVDNTPKVEQISIKLLRENNQDEIAKLIRATTTIGFYYAVDHGIDTNRVRKEATSFFDLDLDDKKVIHLEKSPHYRGYTLIDEEITQGIPDHKETLDFAMEESAEPDRPEAWMVMRGPNQFPEKMPTMSGLVQDYMKQVGEVGQVIM